MIEIYKNFELITIDPSFTNFKWRRQFSRSGEFQLTTFFTQEKFIDIFAIGNVIYKRNTDEAAFIESRQVLQDMENNLILIVRGRMISSLLDRRIFTLSGSYNLKSFLDTIINDNFLVNAGSYRQISNLRLLPYSLHAATIEADFKQQNVYDTLLKMLQEHNVGFKILYNLHNKTYDLVFYDVMPSDTVFSREFANIVEQDYSDDTEQYRNVVYVEDEYIHNDTLYAGLNRREMAISKPSEGAEYLTQNAINALSENRETKTLSNVINPYSKQFEYLKDWDLGSLVLARNDELGYAEQEIISEITEFYDAAGLNLEVNLGDYIIRK